jgi:hypothetical protein
MTLGLPPEAHKRRSKTARYATYKHMREARKNLDKGACTKAIKSLVRTAAAHGMAAAEYEAATSTARFPGTRAAVEKLEREVLRRCVCMKRKKRKK